MTKNLLLAVLQKLLKASSNARIKIVIMGGIATSVLSRPRATYDIDGIVALSKEELKNFTALLKTQGFKFETKEPLKFIAGLPFITFYYPRHKIYVDLFVAKNEFQYNILKRAKKIKLNSLSIHIISAEDLILLKLQTGREKDIEDAREIIWENVRKLDFRYLHKWATAFKVGIFLKDELRSLGLKNKAIIKK